MRRHPPGLRPNLRPTAFVCLFLLSWPVCGAVSSLEFLGEARIRGGLTIEGTAVGGLSGITYDADRGVFYAVSDDPSARAPARFYTLEIDLATGRLEAGGVQVVGTTKLLDPSGQTLERLSVDPEGIGQHPSGDLYLSSEGQIRRQVAPFVRRYSLDGAHLGELALPERYLPRADGTAGPRHNLVFESLTVTPDGSQLFTALENALIEDGPEATLAAGSVSRLLRFDLEDGSLIAEYVYPTEPVAAPASVPDGIEVSGLVDLLALDRDTLLAMERSFSMGVGNSIRLFLVRLAGATDVQRVPALADLDPTELIPVEKELLLDLAELDLYLDNLEGVTLGPPLGDGRSTLILVSDDNFNPLVQATQVFAFALGHGAIEVQTIQGAGHRSPLEGRWVRGVEGLVTASYPEREHGFWMEAPGADGSEAVSRGLLVLQREDDPTVAVGDRLRLAGRVMEGARPGDLGTTSLRASRIEVLATGRPLPPPVRLGPGGRRVPTEVVDDDGLRVFEPAFDGLDFWESLEGMRVELPQPRVLEGTNRYGDLAVDASGQRHGSAGTPVGGLLLRPGDLNPERLTLDFAGLEESPGADVGATFAGPVTGVVGYRYSSYRLYVQSPLPDIVPATAPVEKTELSAGPDRLTLASFNVMNLSAANDESRFRAVAETLTRTLGSPDVVALQEIQDDTGPVDDGVVAAGETLARLIEAVRRQGGPTYRAYQIDPENNRDGGQPGANIRVAFLVDPERVVVVDRGPAGSTTAAGWRRYPEGVGLDSNPARIAPAAPAFAGDEVRGFSASRKPLALEIRFGERRLFVVNNHWSSKGDDEPTFGARQPPVRHSEDQRSQQARVVADFIDELLELDPGAAVVVLGDLNEHEFRTPLRVATAGELANLTWTLPPEDRYSFNFRGNSQMLDHVLVNRGLLDRVRVRVDILHVNSDVRHARRSSDHDPLLVELDFTAVD